MSVTLKRGPITAEEFQRCYEHERYDLIRGELYPMPPMTGAEHGDLTFDFSLDIGLYVREHDLGKCFAAETRFKIERDPDTAIGPDLAFVAKERLPKKLPKEYLVLAPDLVLEVRSPGDRKGAVMKKVQRWLAAGVRLVWELNPATQILTVYRPGMPPRQLGIDDILTGEDVLPGFTFPLRRLFRDLIP